jgi:hypothetical protein
LGVLGCDDADAEADDAANPADAGAPDATASQSCPAGELSLPNGDCQRPGVPPDGCGEGFEADGDAGCTPVLPATPCGDGEMAVPGEASCRSVGACADGTWGDIQTDETTQHVDASYRGGASDGTSMHPWTTINQAIEAAPAGGLVAVAEGSYLEDLQIVDRPLRLRGRCAGLVEIVGTGAVPDTVRIGGAADETIVADVSVTGPGVAVQVQGAKGVAIDRVWLHDLGLTGVAVRNGGQVAITRSLIDGAGDDGVLVASASSADVDATVIRNTTAVQSTAVGVFVTSGVASGTRPSASVRGSVVEATEGAGLFIEGSDVVVEGTVIRDTFHPVFGWGIAAQDDASGAPASVEVRTSVIERNHDSGVFVGGSEVIIERSVVRDTLPTSSDLERGTGIAVQSSEVTGGPSTLVLRSSLVQASHAAGCYLQGSTGEISTTLIRDTRPQETDGWFGRGVDVADDAAGAGSMLTLRDSIIERSHEIGLLIDCSEATIDNVAVRDTQARGYDGAFGRGVQIQTFGACDAAVAGISRAAIERNRDVGIAVIDAVATVDSTVVEGTQPTTIGTFGDGIAVVSSYRSAEVTISACRVVANARAGVTSFGATVLVTGTSLECNPIHLAGELGLDGSPFELEDGGGNICGCENVETACAVQTANLQSPTPLSDSHD